MPGGWLGGFLVYYAVQRGYELALSARNVRHVRSLGGVEHGASHFPFLVTAHALLPIALVAEVVVLRASPPLLWPAWLALFAAAQALRYWSIHTLGPRWNVRIWVVPGLPLVRTGPYRLLRHPNYVAVVAELVAAPMMFGAWRTALFVSLINAVALRVRVRAENRALDAADRTRAPAQK